MECKVCKLRPGDLFVKNIDSVHKVVSHMSAQLLGYEGADVAVIKNNYCQNHQSKDRSYLSVITNIPIHP